MSYKYDVSIIIVNFNGKKYLHNLFESLIKIKHDGFDFEIIFVDNNSNDGSTDYIETCKWKEKIPIKVICNTENQGFAMGNNTGVANAEGKYIVFLNNDTAVTENWLSELYYYIERKADCGIAASKLLFFNDFIEVSFKTNDNIFLEKQITMNGQQYTIEDKFCKNILNNADLVCFGHTKIALPIQWGEGDCDLIFCFKKFDPNSDYINICGEQIGIKNKRLIIHLNRDTIENYRYSIIQNAGSDVNQNFDGFDIGMGERDDSKYNQEKELNSGCGASIILKKDDFYAVGQFDERFFMYYEDVDLSFRIRKLGKKIMYCPQSVVRHVHTGSSKEWSPFFAYHVFRNKLLFLYKDVSKRIFLKYLIRQMLAGIYKRDRIKLVAAIDAIKILYFPMLYKNNRELGRKS